MTNFPKITIITPVYNRVEFLEETILSVLNQNYPNLEYIIIDAGSTDGTVEIIKKYEKELLYWVSEPDNGMYYALQKGFEKSTGLIMAWLNSDDKYNTRSLFNVANVFMDLPEVEWIVGVPSMYNHEGICVQVSPGIKWSYSGFKIGHFRWIQQESTFWRRSLWEKAGGNLNTKYKYAGDFELWCRFFKYTQLYTVRTLLGGFRLHGNQISVKKDDFYESEVSEIIKSLSRGNKHQVVAQIMAPISDFEISVKKITVRLLKYISKKLVNISEEILKSPKDIYYDFEESKWKKCLFASHDPVQFKGNRLNH